MCLTVTLFHQAQDIVEYLTQLSSLINGMTHLVDPLAKSFEPMSF